MRFDKNQPFRSKKYPKILLLEKKALLLPTENINYSTKQNR